MDSKKASPSPRLLGELVEEREMKMSPEMCCSYRLINFFTCDERVGVEVSSGGVVVPEEETDFLGAMTKDGFGNRGDLQKIRRSYGGSEIKIVRQNWLRKETFIRRMGTIPNVFKIGRASCRERV